MKTLALILLNLDRFLLSLSFPSDKLLLLDLMLGTCLLDVSGLLLLDIPLAMATLILSRAKFSKEEGSDLYFSAFLGFLILGTCTLDLSGCLKLDYCCGFIGFSAIGDFSDIKDFP